MYVITIKKYNPIKVSIKKYDLRSEVAINSDNSVAFFNQNKSPADIISRPEKVAILDTNFTHQTRMDDDKISKMCALYIGSKLTQILRQDKKMTSITNKLEEVHVNL